MLVRSQMQDVRLETARDKDWRESARGRGCAMQGRQNKYNKERRFRAEEGKEARKGLRRSGPRRANKTLRTSLWPSNRRSSFHTPAQKLLGSNDGASAAATTTRYSIALCPLRQDPRRRACRSGDPIHTSREPVCHHISLLYCTVDASHGSRLTCPSSFGFPCVSTRTPRQFTAMTSLIRRASAVCA